MAKRKKANNRKKEILKAQKKVETWVTETKKEAVKTTEIIEEKVVEVKRKVKNKTKVQELPIKDIKKDLRKTAIFALLFVILIGIFAYQDIGYEDFNWVYQTYLAQYI